MQLLWAIGLLLMATLDGAESIPNGRGFMDEYFDRTLVADFPILYAQRHLTEYRSAFSYGFECNSGWEELIRKLSQHLEFLNEKGVVWVEAAQVKEKFSTLRYYIDILEGEKPWRDIVYDLITAAESRSAYTCEWCGEWGERRNDTGWLRTLCEPCHEQLLEQKRAKA